MKCALCLEDRKLCDSHLIPEFFYKPVYEGPHRYYQVPTSPVKKVVPRQKGIFEKLLCRECEKRLMVLEDYSRRVLYGGVEISIARARDRVLIDDINYEKFKLLQMSLLWRAGVSKRPEFSNVTLGPHADNLRQLIYSRDPGEPHRYGCMMILSPKLQELLSHMIMLPDMVRVAGHRCVRFVLGGLFWLFFTSSHTRELASKNAFLSKDGKLPLILENRWSVTFVNEFAKQLHDSGHLDSFEGSP